MSTRSELLSAKMVASVKGITTDTYPAHPHLKVLDSHVISLEHELSVLNRQVATRPNPPLYSALTKVNFYNLLQRMRVRVLVIHLFCPNAN